MILSPEEKFYIHLASLQMTPEQHEQMADEILREMRRHEFDELMQNEDFIESLEQMARGEGIVYRPKDLEDLRQPDVDDAFKEQVHRFMADNDTALRRLASGGREDD